MTVLQRQLAYIDIDVFFFLPPFLVQALCEIALLVEKPDTDQGNPQVRGAFQMVTRQDAQAPGIDLQGFMQAELGREIDHGPVVQIAAVNGAPGLLQLDIFIEPPEGIVYTAVEHQLRGAFLNLSRGDLIHEGNRVMFNLSPDMRVQVGEDAYDLWMPCPPEVISQSPETFMKIDVHVCHR